MIYLNVLLSVKEASSVEKVAELLKKACTLSRKEPGCERFEVYHSQNDPQRFILNEWWTDQAALDQHRLAEAYTTVYQPHVIPLVERQPHPSTLLC